MNILLHQKFSDASWKLNCTTLQRVWRNCSGQETGGALCITWFNLDFGVVINSNDDSGFWSWHYFPEMKWWEVQNQRVLFNFLVVVPVKVGNIFSIGVWSRLLEKKTSRLSTKSSKIHCSLPFYIIFSSFISFETSITLTVTGLFQLWTIYITRVMRREHHFRTGII